MGWRIKTESHGGMERNMQKAGHRHLHWSVQKLPGSTEKEWMSRIQSEIGESVPFDFLVKQGDQIKMIDVAGLQCEHANIDLSNDRQAIFNGLF